MSYADMPTWAVDTLPTQRVPKRSFLPHAMITRGVGKLWIEDSMYLTSKALETINRLNPSNKKSTELPVSVLRRSALKSGHVLSVYPVTFPHPPSFCVLRHKDHTQTLSEMTVLRGKAFIKNTAYEEWLNQGMEGEEKMEMKSLEMKDDQDGFWRCLCCCCAGK